MSFRGLTPFRRSSLAPRDEQDSFFPWRRDIDRVFEDMFKSFGQLPSVWGSGAGAPSIDVKESKDGIEVTAELPGVDEKDVEVELTDDLLTIRGEKKAERSEEDKEKGYHVQERSYGSFQRSIRLPFRAESEKVTADFKKGVLKVSCPRPAGASIAGRKIDINAQ